MKNEHAPGSFVLGYDEFTGTLDKMHITPDNKTVFESIVDIDSIAEQNKRERNSVSRTSGTGDMVKAASLPMMVYLDLRSRGILNDKGLMRKWLASDEASPYRTHWMKS